MEARESEDAVFSLSGELSPGGSRALSEESQALRRRRGSRQQQMNPPSPAVHRRPSIHRAYSSGSAAGASFHYSVPEASASIMKHSIREGGAATARPGGVMGPAPTTSELMRDVPKLGSGGVPRVLHGGHLPDISARSLLPDIYDGEPLGHVGTVSGATGRGADGGAGGFHRRPGEASYNGPPVSDKQTPSYESRSDSSRGERLGRDALGNSMLSSSLLPAPSRPWRALRAPCPFCCLPGDPKWALVVGMVSLTVLFLVVPVGCAMLLQPLYAYLYTDLPDAVTLYVETCKVAVALTSFQDTAELFLYFGSNIPVELINPEYRVSAGSFKSTLDIDPGDRTPGLVAVEYFLVSIQERLNTLSKSPLFVDSSAAIVSATANFHNVLFPKLVNDALQQQKLLALANTNAAERGVITNSLYTSKAVATLARALDVMQTARLGCYEVVECWENGGRAKIDELAALIGRISAGAAAVINDVFASIEDPRGNSNDLPEIVSLNLQRIANRSAMLTAMLDWETDLGVLLQALTDAETDVLAPGTSVAVTPITLALFALPIGWQDIVREAINKSITIAASISSYYNERSPIPDWLGTGAVIELAVNINDNEIVSAVRTIHSYFGLDIAESLVLNISEAEEEANTNVYINGGFVQYITGMGIMFANTRAEARNNVLKTIQTEGSFKGSKVRVRAIIILCVSLGLSVVPYVMMTCVVRYRVTASPFPFWAVLAVLFLMFSVQCVVSGMIYRSTVRAAELKRTISVGLLDSVSESLDIIDEAALVLNTGLQMSLLIVRNLSAGETLLTNLETLSQEVAVQAIARPWMRPLIQFIENVQAFLGNGFFPVRQQLSASSSMKLSTTAISEMLGVGMATDTATDPDVTRYAPCWAPMGASSLHILTSSYLLMSMVSEKVSKGVMSIDVLDSSGMSRGALEGSCVTNAVVSASDASMPKCYVDSICAWPSAYGLLRDLKSSVGAFTLLNPQRSNLVGDLLLSWASMGINGIPTEFNAQLSRVTDAATMDVTSVNNTRRLIIWLGVFTCLGLQVAVLFLWHVIIGQSYFVKVL